MKELDGVTLIGELIGNNDRLQYVKYSRESIIFYTAVDNNSADTCWPCDKAHALFDKYGLDKVPIQSLGEFKEFD